MTSAPAVWPADSPVLALDAPHRASPRLVAGVLAGCVAILVVAAIAVAIPAVRWPVLPGFNWAYVTLYLVTGLVTAVLLMQATPETWSWPLALLAAGYVYSALVTVPFLLSFPGGFGDDPVPLVGGSQSAVWTYYLWCAGFLAFVLASTIVAMTLRSRLAATSDPGDRGRSPTRATAVLLGVVPAVVLAIVVLAAGSWLPDLLGEGLSGQKTLTFHVLSWSVVAFGLLTLVLVVAESRHGSPLRVWLVPVVLLTAFEAVQLPSTGRYQIGWYAPRILGMIATTVLLVALLVQVWRQAKALAAARAQSDRLAKIVEQSPAGFALLDRGGRVVEVNQALCDLTGFPHDDLIGASSGVLPGDPDESLAGVASLLVGDTRSLTLRRRITRRDGSSVWVHLAAHRMTDASGRFAGVAVSASDASGEVAADLDPHAPVGMAVVSEHGVITRATEALCVLVGRDRAALVGTRFDELIAAEDRSTEAAAVEQMRRAEVEVSGSEMRLVRDSGSRFWAAVYRSALRDAHGQLVGIAIQVIDVDDRRKAEAAALEARRFLEHRSTYDDLTGLLNRPTLVDRLQGELDAGSAMAVLVVDIDRFRRVSNAMTRREADAVLVEAARRLASLVGSDGIVARVGGDEFALAIRVPPAHPSSAAEDWAGMVRDALAAGPMGPPGHEIHLTCCVGVTVAQPGNEAADRVQEADLATREAKASGQGQCLLYDERMRQALLARLAMVERIRAGLAAREFGAWFQPVVSLEDGRLLGYEALSRWIRPHGEVILPGEYLPASEDSGLVVPVGACAIDAALACLSALPEPLTIAVNASPTELLTSDFAGHLDAGLRQYGIAPGRVIVEITEQALFDSHRVEDAGLARLANLGVALYVDDFGTGYSSITHLRDFPIRGIKLDRSFTAELGGEGDRAAEIASMLAGLATRLGLDSVAEGVETPAQAERLAAMGWRAGQGWLFGRPQPAPAADGLKVSPLPPDTRSMSSQQVPSGPGHR